MQDARDPGDDAAAERASEEDRSTVAVLTARLSAEFARLPVAQVERAARQALRAARFLAFAPEEMLRVAERIARRTLSALPGQGRGADRED